MLNYIICLVFNKNKSLVVGLTKLKGPSHLIGRVTFPGGKIEEGESIFEAASREMLEETGLTISKDNWIKVGTKLNPSFNLAIVTCAVDVLTVSQQEIEPVWILDVDFSIDQANAQPSAYAEDFIEILAMSRSTIP